MLLFYDAAEGNIRPVLNSSPTPLVLQLLNHLMLKEQPFILPVIWRVCALSGRKVKPYGRDSYRMLGLRRLLRPVGARPG
jgi:hypothetical protein